MFRFLRKTRGVTLMEMAIVMGISGLVLAAVWGAARAVQSGSDVKNTSDDMMLVIENMRSLYSGRNVFATTGSTAIAPDADATAALVLSGVFPQAMLRNPNPGTACSATNACLPYDGWGGRVYIKGGTSSNVFRYYVNGISSKDQCEQLVMRILKSNGLAKVMLSGSTWVDASDYTKVKLSALSCSADATMSNLYMAGFEFSLWPTDN